eukprot:RCo004060
MNALTRHLSRVLDDEEFSVPRSAALRDVRALELVRFARELPYTLRDLSPQGCLPSEAAVVVLGTLRKVCRCWPLVQLRLRVLKSAARRIQAWYRMQAVLLQQCREEVLQYWIHAESTRRKSLQGQMHKDYRVSKDRALLAARGYVRLHKSEDVMRSAVETLYKERRSRFVTQYHEWFTHLRSVRSEIHSLGGRLFGNGRGAGGSGGGGSPAAR